MAKTDKPLSTPNTHRKSPAALLIENDAAGKGLKPDSQFSNTKVKIDPPVEFEEVTPMPTQPMPYNPEHSVRPGPLQAPMQALPNQDIEALKEANKILSKQLDDLKQTVLLPNIKAQYEGKLFVEKGIFHIILKVFRFDEISCRRIGPDLYDIVRKKMEDWEHIELVSADSKDFVAVLAQLQKDIEKTLANLV